MGLSLYKTVHFKIGENSHKARVRRALSSSVHHLRANWNEIVELLGKARVASSLDGDGDLDTTEVDKLSERISELSENVNTLIEQHVVSMDVEFEHPETLNSVTWSDLGEEERLKFLDIYDTEVAIPIMLSLMERPSEEDLGKSKRPSEP